MTSGTTRTTAARVLGARPGTPLFVNNKYPASGIILYFTEDIPLIRPYSALTTAALRRPLRLLLLLLLLLPKFLFLTMAKRRKNRTHLKQPDAQHDNTPSSFIIKHGQVGSSLAQLVRDLRKVMEPNTATRLKVCCHLIIIPVSLSHWYILAYMHIYLKISTGTFKKQAQRLLDSRPGVACNPLTRIDPHSGSPFTTHC